MFQDLVGIILPFLPWSEERNKLNWFRPGFDKVRGEIPGNHKMGESNRHYEKILDGATVIASVIL